MIVLAVIASVVGGGYLVGAALAEPAGPAVDVGGVVRLQPLSGWAAAEHGARSVRLTRGGGNLDVVLAAAPNAAVLLHRYLLPLDRSPSQVSLSPTVTSFKLDSGLQGLRASYVGSIPSREVTSVEGEITAVVLPDGTGVIFDGWAPKGLFSYVDRDLDRMTASAQIAPDRGVP
ncbi:MAG: hypothetical protein ACJ758_05685 [Actinomycetota bacterium]